MDPGIEQEVADPHESSRLACAQVALQALVLVTDDRLEGVEQLVVYGHLVPDSVSRPGVTGDCLKRSM